MVCVYLENAWVYSPRFRSAWQDPSPARLCWALSPARQPKGKQHWHFLYKRARDKKESRLLWLSGKSNKGLSTAVRMTQGDLPGSINSTLLSVPKPNSWHVKTLPSIPASAQISVGADLARCWAPLSRSLETLLSWEQNTWEGLLAVNGAQNGLLFPLALFSLSFRSVCTSYRYIFYGVCPSEVPCHLLQGKALTWNYVNRHKPSEEQLQHLFHLVPNSYCK